MGKLKIEKKKKNKNTKGSSGIPNWLLSTLVILVVLAVIGTCVGTAVASSGVAMRWSTAMELNNFKVNGNMMSYFYQTTYMNFINNYSSYLNYLSIDKDSSLKDQQFNPEGSYDAAILGEFEGTWHEFFLEQTKNDVTQLLLYCAEAERLKITLDDDDKTEIEASIDALLADFRAFYGELSEDSSEDSCFANLYGNGVNRGDVRKAMELSALASKCAEHISKTIEDSITDDRIVSEYNDNKLDYDLVDYYKYSFTVYYSDAISELHGDEKKAEDLTDAEKEAVLALYTEKIAAARKAAEELAAITTLDDFRNYAVKYEITSGYDETFDSKTSDLDASKKPTEEELATIKAKTIESILADLAAGKTEFVDDVVKTDVPATDDTPASTNYNLHGISIYADFAKDMSEVKSSLFASALKVKDDNLLEKVNYVAPTKDKDGNEEKDEMSEWAFSSDRKVNDVKNFEDGDGANGATVAASDEMFSADVIFMTKTVYRDETLSRDLAYMLFADSETPSAALAAAEAAIKELGKIEGLDKDKFLELANDSSNPASASTFLEDCAIGTMQEESFDEWLYNAKVGEYTAEPLKMSDGSYMVGLYVAENTTPKWKYNVKGNIYADDYDAYENKMNEDFASSVVINDKTVKKVGV